MDLAIGRNEVEIVLGICPIDADRDGDWLVHELIYGGCNERVASGSA